MGVKIVIFHKDMENPGYELTRHLQMEYNQIQFGIAVPEAGRIGGDGQRQKGYPFCAAYEGLYAAILLDAARF